MPPDDPHEPLRDRGPGPAPGGRPRGEVPEPVLLASTPLLSLTGPVEGPPDDGRRWGTLLRVGVPVLVVVVVLAALGVAMFRLLAGGASGVEAVPATSSSSPGTGSTDADAGSGSGSGSGSADPLGVGTGLVDLACTDDYVVVLASTRGTASEASFVQQPLQRFGSTSVPGHYLSVAGSCAALRGSANKSGSAYLPYLGPFATPVAACQARMAHADTTTYVLRLGSDVGGDSTCSCSYGASSLPDLDPEDDAVATGDDRFWVVELQAMLGRAGHPVPKPHVARYGPGTTAGVRALQADAGLAITGAMDGPTWRALIDVAC